MKGRCILFAGVVVTLAATPATAQPGAPAAAAVRQYEQTFEALTASTLETLDTLRRAVERSSEEAAAERQSRMRQVSVRAPSLSSANASTAVDLAQAAISTDVKGATAGVTVNPVALAGHPSSQAQVALTLAALEDSVTRFQAGLSWQFRSEPRLDLPSCVPTPEDLASWRRQITDARASYVRACVVVDRLAAVPGMSSSQRRYLDTARAQCGSIPDQRPMKTLGTARDTMVKAIEALQREPSPDERVREALYREELFDLLRELSAYKQPPIDCQTREAIADAVVRASWNVPRLRVGASVRADVFPRKLGFFPDPMTPRELRRSDSEARLEASYGRARLEATAGIGIGAARAKLGADLVTYYAPSLSFAWTVGSLTGDPLYKDGRLNVIGGNLPPRLVLGLDAQLQYAPDPPAGQVVKVQKLSITGYADFRFTEKLTVRIGIPITAKLETRDGDTSAGGMDKIDRQWTLSPFVASVLKL